MNKSFKCSEKKKILRFIKIYIFCFIFYRIFNNFSKREKYIYFDILLYSIIILNNIKHRQKCDLFLNTTNRANFIFE